MTTITIDSRQRVELIDITEKVRAAIRDRGIADGLAVVYTPHTTAAITINENADPDVAIDLVMALNKLVPFDDHYHHAEGNSAAHVKSTLVGASETLIVENNIPVLGTWQGIYFCEFDGPRRRQVHVKVIGT
ncbi:MAG: secondary thiamine-phosphate synthase enzyme YjbQ [Desulfuromonadales bacterium]|nr:secondary thiamine-phosphate synthase enzyme YjbQ [Desulfuromonadales bacterium]